MDDQAFTNTLTYTLVLGGYEPGVTRRDPSPVIKVGERYYVRDHFAPTTWGPGITWGLCHDTSKLRLYLMRFECSPVPDG